MSDRSGHTVSVSEQQSMIPEVIGSADFRRLFIHDIPLLDVRAPVEFQAGAFPRSDNRPLLDDEQRQVIGSTYAEYGQDKAVERGLEMATADVRAQRLAAWNEFVSANPEGALYCFRGGLRSKISQQWLAEQGLAYPRVDGGYKALRRFLLAELERFCASSQILLLAGATACGKTDVIHAWSASIDLEGHARHRGSAFGTCFTDQPAQVSFENALIADCLKKEAQGYKILLVEAESRLIGRLHVPLVLQEAMRRAPVIELHASREERLQRLQRDYIDFAIAHFSAADTEPWPALKQYITKALSGIQRRLGGKKTSELLELLDISIAQLRDQQSSQGFRQMFAELLDHYYDRQYAHQLSRYPRKIVLRGNQSEVLQWLAEQAQEDSRARA